MFGTLCISAHGRRSCLGRGVHSAECHFSYKKVKFSISCVLCRLLQKSSRMSMIRNAIWCLSNLCRGKNPPPDFSKVLFQPCLHLLPIFIRRFSLSARYLLHFLPVIIPRYLAATQCIVIDPVCGCVCVFVGLLPW